MLLTLLLGAEPVAAEPAPYVVGQFQARIDEVARALEGEPRLKHFSQKQRQEVTEFVVGNMLFVVLHEMGHALISDMALPVLGREEDAADAFAAVTMIRIGTSFTQRVLAEAARGWFLSDRRDREEGEKLDYYDAHGLDRQRAYQIVCLMVGSSREQFKDLATQTKMPEARQGSCEVDYSNAQWSWDTALKPHRRAAEQPKTKIEMAYGEGKGKFDIYARSFRHVQLLETVAAYAADRYVWPKPLALEMQRCGESITGWSSPTRKITLCYELGAEFVELYRAYSREWVVPALKRVR